MTTYTTPAPATNPLAPFRPATTSDLAAMDAGELVAAHLDGNSQAFSEIVRRYRVRLLNFIYRMIGDRERAEDLVQEALVRVHRHLHRFDRGRKFSTWIYTIASNLAKNELRNRSRSPIVLYQTLRSGRAQGDDTRAPDFEDSHNRPDDLYRQRHLRELVERAVAQLTTHHREVFVLRELQGRSYEEISEVTGSNLGTVKSRLNRARTAFADLIAPHLD